MHLKRSFLIFLHSVQTVDHWEREKKARADVEKVKRKLEGDLKVGTFGEKKEAFSGLLLTLYLKFRNYLHSRWRKTAWKKLEWRNSTPTRRFASKCSLVSPSWKQWLWGTRSLLKALDANMIYFVYLCVCLGNKVFGGRGVCGSVGVIGEAFMWNPPLDNPPRHLTIIDPYSSPLDSPFLEIVPLNFRCQTLYAFPLDSHCSQ